MTQPDAGTAPSTDFPAGFGAEPDALPAEETPDVFAPEADADADAEPEEETEDAEALPKWAQAKLAALEKDNFKYRTKLRDATKKAPAATKTPAADTVAPDAAAVDDIRAQARAEAKVEFSEQLAEERLTAGLMQLGIENAQEVVSDLNMTRFVTDDGDVNAEAVKDALLRYKTLAPKRRKTVGAGNSGGGGSTRSNADQFAQALGLLPS